MKIRLKVEVLELGALMDYYFENHQNVMHLVKVPNIEDIARFEIYRELERFNLRISGRFWEGKRKPEVQIALSYSQWRILGKDLRLRCPDSFCQNVLAKVDLMLMSRFGYGVLAMETH